MLVIDPLGRGHAAGQPEPRGDRAAVRLGLADGERLGGRVGSMPEASGAPTGDRGHHGPPRGGSTASSECAGGSGPGCAGSTTTATGGAVKPRPAGTKCRPPGPPDRT